MMLHRHFEAERASKPAKAKSKEVKSEEAPKRETKTKKTAE